MVVVEEEIERKGEEGELELGVHWVWDLFGMNLSLNFFRVKLRMGVESEGGSF